MAIIWLLPVPNRKPPASGIYLCPIYKTLTRAGKCPSPISRSKEDCSSWEGSPGEAAAKCCTHGHRARHCWMRLSREKRFLLPWLWRWSKRAPSCCSSASGQALLKPTTKTTQASFLPLLLGLSLRTGMRQGASHCWVTSTGLPGQWAAARAAVPPACPCLPHYRHAVDNGPLHQLRDRCGDPYGQVTEALDQTGHSLDLRPGLLAQGTSPAGACTKAGSRSCSPTSPALRAVSINGAQLHRCHIHLVLQSP